MLKGVTIALVIKKLINSQDNADTADFIKAYNLNAPGNLDKKLGGQLDKVVNEELSVDGVKDSAQVDKADCPKEMNTCL